jgi:positive regulator of sigma E activity
MVDPKIGIDAFVGLAVTIEVVGIIVFFIIKLGLKEGFMRFASSTIVTLLVFFLIYIFVSYLRSEALGVAIFLILLLFFSRFVYKDYQANKEKYESKVRRVKL